MVVIWLVDSKESWDMSLDRILLLMNQSLYWKVLIGRLVQAISLPAVGTTLFGYLLRYLIKFQQRQSRVNELFDSCDIASNGFPPFFLMVLMIENTMQNFIPSSAKRKD